MSLRAGAAVLVLTTVSSTLLRAQVPAGDEFVVSTNGSSPSLAADAAGNFVIAFARGTDEDPSDVAARRYDASGAPLGPEFAVNTYTTGCQGNAFGVDAASDSAGDVVVVWVSFGCYGTPSQDGSDGGIYAQRYDPSGLPRGSEFRVNTYTPGAQENPAVASDGAGNTVVIWNGPDGSSGRGVFGQRYDAGGQPVGGEFRVETQTGMQRHFPSLAMNDDGAFIVAWELWTQDWQQQLGIFARRFAPSGAPLGAEFRVDEAAGTTTVASVAMNAQGGFVVTFHRAVAGGFELRARRFDGTGTPLGAELVVDAAPGFGGRPSLTMDSGGNFAVAWQKAPDPNHPDEIDAWLRRFDASGAPRGDAVQVGGHTFRVTPSMAADPSGNLIVASTLLHSQVFARRFGGLVPAPAAVDASPTGGSDGNGVVEAGESVEVRSSWRNVNGQAQTFDGRALEISGPAAAGVSYELHDDAAAYGTLPNGGTTSCSDCYAIGVTSDGSRPSTHWDAQLTERLTPDVLGQTSTWPLHIGDSFDDVLRTSPFYRFVETMLHRGVTGGCRSRDFCPRDPVTREQMAVFALVGRHGASYLPPACGSPLFGDVPASSPYCRFIEDLARRGVSSGCGEGNYCPADAITREQAAVVLLRTLDAGLQPPACTPPNMFTDVPEDSPFCRWIEELSRRGIAGGCGNGRFCPHSPTTREQMAVLTAQTFGLSLY